MKVRRLACAVGGIKLKFRALPSKTSGILPMKAEKKLKKFSGNLK